MPNLYAGTSGFAYPSWKPDFYPDKLPSKKFLGYYSGRLNAVEVNYTFRRLPSVISRRAYSTTRAGCPNFRKRRGSRSSRPPVRWEKRGRSPGDGRFGSANTKNGMRQIWQC